MPGRNRVAGRRVWRRGRLSRSLQLPLEDDDGPGPASAAFRDRLPARLFAAERQTLTSDEFVRRFAFALRDLPWRTRRELVADLEDHLAEIPADSELRDRLGSPEQYAADMRDAAGLQRRRGPVAFLRARRPRDLILTVTVLTLVGLVIGSAAWIHSYQPIATGNVGFEPGALDSPTGDGIYYVFHQGRRFRYGMTIWNQGRFTVRVLAVPIEFELPIKYRLLMSRPTTFNYGGLPLPWTPFHPFDLAPGEERAIIFSGTFNEPCNLRSPGSRFWGSIPIRYRFLWHTGTADVPFPEHLTFVFRKDAASGCPATP